MKSKSSLKLLLGLTVFVLPLSACSFFSGGGKKSSSSGWNWDSQSGGQGGNSNSSSYNTPSDQYHTVRFDSRGGSTISSQTVRHGERLYNPGDPWKEGNDFNYWEDKDEKEWNFNTDVVLEDMTLFANYTPRTYHIYLNLNGGSLDNVDPNGSSNSYVEVHYGESFQLPTPKRGGYSFKGWYYNDKEVFTGFYNYTYDIWIEAQWGPLFIVHFDTDGGELLEDYEGFGSRVLTELPEPEKNNCIFTGWSYKGSAVQFPFEIDEGLSEITFVATWKEVKNNFQLTNIDDETVKIVWYNGTDEIVHIPSIINNKRVAEIGEGAFENMAGIKKIVLPKSVTTIGEDAFRSMADLEELVMKVNVTNIGENILLDCPKISKISIPTRNFMLKSFFDYDENLMPSELEITLINPIPRNKDYYSSWGDGHDGEFDDRVFPAYGLFKNLLNVKYDVVFDGSWLFVPSAFFELSSNIKTVTIPGSVPTIGRSAFYGCKYLEKVTLSNGIGFIDESAFYDCDSIKNISVPDSVINIGSSVFYGCDALISATLGSGITTIPSSIFGSCNALKDFEIPYTVTSIGNNSFSYCSSFISMTIPSSVTSIGNNAFYNCYNLSTIIMPASVTFVGESAFSNSGLSYVFFGGTKSQWNRIDMGTTNSVLSSAQIEFESEVASLEFASNDKFSYLLTKDKRVVDFKMIDKSITSFDFAKELPNLTITSLGNGAFEYCYSLLTIEIPDTVSVIPASAFRSCNKLSEVVLPDTITTIKPSAFNGCSSLSEIELPNGLKEIGNSSFGGSGLDTITLPSSLNTIDTYAFSRCSSLKSVYIPKGIGMSSLSEGIFENCITLSAIYIPKKIKTINKESFYNDESLLKVFYEGSEDDWNNVTIYETQNDDNDTYLSKAKVEFNSKISSLNYVKNDDFSYILSNDNSVFSLTILNKSITSFDFSARLPGKTVESINRYGFSGCDYLKSIVIPNSVLSIGSYGFCECDSLISVVLPNKLETIRYCTFYQTYSLREIVIPKSVKKIESSAFYTYYFNNSYVIHTFYSGSEEDWNAIQIDSSNNMLLEGYVTYESPINSLTFVEDTKWSYVLGNDNNIYSFIYLASSSGQTFHYSSVVSEGRELKTLRCYSFKSSYLATITLPKTLTYIGYYAFNTGSSATQVYFDGTMAEWEAIEKDSEWNGGMSNKVIHCSDGDINYSA